MILSVVLALFLHQAALTLLSTAQLIKYRASQAGVIHRQLKVEQQIDQIKSELLAKKSLTNSLNNWQKNDSVAIQVTHTLTNTFATANLVQ